MRVLIRGADFVNKGAEAMLLTVRDQLRTRIPRARFVVEAVSVAPGTEDMCDAAEIERVSVAPGRLATASRLLWRCVRQPLSARQLYDRRAVVAAVDAMVEGCDASIDIAGYAYGDVWGTGPAQRTALYRDSCARMGKPYAFLPQAFGPFERASDKGIYRTACEGAALLYARDSLSRRYVAQLFGTSEGGVQQCNDIAFCFTAQPNTAGQAILDALRLDASDQSLIAVAPNRRLYDRTRGTGAQNSHVRLLAELCRHLAVNGWSVVVVPHEIAAQDTGTTDDRLLCSIIEAMASHPKVRAMASVYDAGTVKAVLLCARAVIGARFHTLVAALSAGIPAFAIGWSHKYSELLASVGLSECASGPERSSTESVLGATDGFLARNEEYRDVLRKRIPAITREVQALFDGVAACLLGRGAGEGREAARDDSVPAIGAQGAARVERAVT